MLARHAVHGLKGAFVRGDAGGADGGAGCCVAPGGAGEGDLGDPRDPGDPGEGVEVWGEVGAEHGGWF